MKKIIIAFVTMLMLAGSYEAKSQINAGISFNTFYDELSPYGRWVDYPSYGQVWISNESGFEPYSTNGHWQYTNYGWMWVSNYDWGWAPFHYGRWAYLNNYGWAWVPGYEWAPAWVGWCNYDGYYGWAPLSPGIGFNYTFSSMPVNYWRFVRCQYINDPYINRHYQRPVRNVNQYQNVTVINNTVVNNNTTYVAGPAQQDVERITKKKIEPRQIAFKDDGVRKTELVNKNEVRVFRPGVKANGEIVQNPQQVKQQPAKQTPQQKQDLIKQQQAIKQTAPVQKENDAVVPGNDIKKQEQVQQLKEQELINQKAQQQETARQQEIIRRQQQQDAIKQQQADTKQQEVIRLQQQQNDARQQEAIRRQQQQDLKKQQAEAKQQEIIRKQQQKNDARQQEALRRQQQQNEARQQEAIRRQQDQMRQNQERQDEIRQQRIEPQQERSFPKQPVERPQPVRQNRKG